ncbi:fam-b protein [Plasmodium yoelii]|uniref:Fam-b protein n=2 Tax=Plasmodium yoelii TaxID=5861 RepID=A0AAF0B6I1_PLAYO|nr:fam-b protein [Plasmodium yoelii]WBY61333.1 fam-b protein [Plasmodium yoelii yoelii]CDS44096.1 fam-b protein [Plasmodium yoelii]VTZ81987.1 fam-b protein [Plasmodium yoelii]|eukprot:XP_022813084.1 fam-b protein [Plasmodium yoelii]
MRVNIFKFVFFSIIICFFEYIKNELYYANERTICFERNIINFRNNRTLAYADNQLNLNDFYQSTLSLANKLNDYNDDNEEIIYIRSAIDSHIKMHKENTKLPDINSLDKRTKKIIRKLQKELEEVKKELDNIGDSEITIKQIRDKRITKTYENNSVSEGEYYNQLENEVNFVETKHNQVYLSSNNHFENKQKLNKMLKGLIVRGLLMTLLSLAVLLSGWIQIPFAIIGVVLSIETFVKCYRYIKLFFKVSKMENILKKLR